jgi:hypothetical protein
MRLHAGRRYVVVCTGDSDAAQRPSAPTSNNQLPACHRFNSSRSPARTAQRQRVCLAGCHCLDGVWQDGLHRLLVDTSQCTDSAHVNTSSGHRVRHTQPNLEESTPHTHLHVAVVFRVAQLAMVVDAKRPQAPSLCGWVCMLQAQIGKPWWQLLQGCRNTPPVMRQTRSCAKPAAAPCCGCCSAHIRPTTDPALPPLPCRQLKRVARSLTCDHGRVCAARRYAHHAQQLRDDSGEELAVLRAQPQPAKLPIAPAGCQALQRARHAAAVFGRAVCVCVCGACCVQGWRCTATP